MELKTETIENIFKDMKEYGKGNFGVRCGEDFPTIAKALVETEAFKSLSSAGIAMVMLTAIMGDKKASGEKRTDEILEMAPLKNPLAEAFYAGYKLGKAQTEVQSLNNSMEGK